MLASLKNSNVMKANCAILDLIRPLCRRHLSVLPRPRRLQVDVKEEIIGDVCNVRSRGRRVAIWGGNSLLCTVKYSTSSSPSPTVLFRKLLPVLVKQIHPDLFGSYEDEVRLKNMKCTQTLNEFWFALIDVVQETTVKFDKGAHGGPINLQIPLNPSYDFKCALKTNSESGEEALIHISHSIKVPSILCSKQLITRGQAYDALIYVYKDLEGLCNVFNARKLWQDFINTQGNLRTFIDSTQNSSSKNPQAKRCDEYETSFGLPPDIHRSLQKRVASKYVYRARTPVSYFSSSKSDVLRQHFFLIDEIDYYFGNGHVRIKDVDIIGQVTKLKKLRKIMIRYGDSINFQMSLWYKVVMILSGSDSEYSTEQIKDRYIVIIPDKFYAKPLMEHLRKTIPYSNPFADHDLQN